jgi:mannosyltransferase OCH1-like enzyme
VIPRIIHQVWVGDEMPKGVDDLIATWLLFHPDWEHRLWGDGDLGWLYNRQLFDDLPDLVAGHSVGQARADVARYEILAEHGGIYVDVDFEARAPIDSLIEGRRGFATRSARQANRVANGIVGCEPGHPTLVRARQFVDEHARRRGDGRLWAANVTGPRFFTDMIRGNDPIDLLPARLFYPYSWRNLNAYVDMSGCYAVHHWLHRRQVEGKWPPW